MKHLARDLLSISSVDPKSLKRHIELTIVHQNDIKPWVYPPKFDFQYGDWLREDFEKGNAEPWKTKVNADLAILITQVRLSCLTLAGKPVERILDAVPYGDFMRAAVNEVESLLPELEDDTRNVLLTLARIWSTIQTDQIRSKPEAAKWAIENLPEQYKEFFVRAQRIMAGHQQDDWSDVLTEVEACAQYIVEQINLASKQIDYSSKDRQISYCMPGAELVERNPDNQ